MTTALPYIVQMQTVLLTQTFLRHADAAGLTEDELQDIATVIAGDPLCGDQIAGTGGARKLRHAGYGKGKSGGYRTIHYYGGDDVPVFLLAVYGKNRKANLTKAERNDLTRLLPQIADACRRGTRS